MRRWLPSWVGSTAALVLAGSLLIATSAAQAATLTQVSGTSSGAGQLTRTIIDVVPQLGPGHSAQAIRTVTVTINSAGKSSNFVGRALRDSLNDQIGAFGYTANFPSPTDSTHVLLQKSSGSFSQSDVNAIPGITVANIALPAVSPFGIVVLVAALLGLALWSIRRRKAA